jgi:hypothetical protein
MILQEETKQKNKLFVIWYGFLALSIIIVVWLFLFNSYFENKIQNLEENIWKYNTSIKKLQENRSVQVYTLLEENKKLVESLEKKSKINNFIYNIRELQTAYTIIFKWFNYSNWIISTSVFVPFNINMTAANRVSYFIKSYREDKNSLFDLDFINTFNWNDNMTFNVNFKLK